MKAIIKSIYKLFVMFGINPLQTIRAFKGVPIYYKNRKLLKHQEKDGGKKFPFATPYPCLSDRFESAGEATGHYFHQDLLVARRIYANNPSRHIDIGSRIDGFVAHVASFRKLEIIDVRSMVYNIPNVTFSQADLMKGLDSKLEECCDSLSCLHALEHFGLGRYGDPVNYNGYLLGLDNLYLILKKGGKFYFSVPIGPQRIEFDAHRVFSISYLLELFDNKYHIDHFSYVDDKGDLHENELITDKSKNDNFNCNYGCGIFEMTKL